MVNTQVVIAFVLAAILSYLLGSLNFALLISHFIAKDDIRRHGSGNAGMTNILRTYGKKAAIGTAAGDFLKAILAIALSRLIFARFGVTIMDAGYYSGLFVLLGHMHPLYFHFKGGKGVVTSFAVIFATNPHVFLVISILIIPLILLTKIVSLGSVLGAVIYPFLTFLVLYLQKKPAVYDTVFAAVIAIIVLYKHRENVKRLLSGTEHKFGQKE